jgi:hypothetical protein
MMILIEKPEMFFLCNISARKDATKNMARYNKVITLFQSISRHGHKMAKFK